MVIIGIVTFIVAIIYWFLIRDGENPAGHSKTDSLNNEWQRLTYLTRQPQVWWVALCGLVSWVPVGVIGALWGMPYLMKVYGWNNVLAGKVCSLFWLGLAIGSPLAGWLSNRIASRKKLFIVCFSVGLIAAILIINAPYLSPRVIALALFLLGVSASVQVLTFSVIKDIVPPSVFGSASGITNMAAILGGGVAQTFVGFLLHFEWNGVRLHHIPI